MIPNKATLHNTALLVVDVINSCAHQAYEDPNRDICFSKIRQMVPSLAAFITAYRNCGGLVILMTTVPWQEAYLADNVNELYRNDERARYWSADSSGRAEQFYEIPTDGAIVFSKNSYDAFSCRGFVRELAARRIQYVIVTGVFGDGCVLATICGGFSRGYHLIIARDLIETTDGANRQALQQQLKDTTWPMMYGPTVDSGVILSTFSERR